MAVVRRFIAFKPAAPEKAQVDVHAERRSRIPGSLNSTLYSPCANIHECVIVVNRRALRGVPDGDSLEFDVSDTT